MPIISVAEARCEIEFAAKHAEPVAGAAVVATGWWEWRASEREWRAYSAEECGRLDALRDGTDARADVSATHFVQRLPNGCFVQRRRDAPERRRLVREYAVRGAYVFPGLMARVPDGALEEVAAGEVERVH